MKMYRVFQFKARVLLQRHLLLLKFSKYSPLLQIHKELHRFVNDAPQCRSLPNRSMGGSPRKMRLLRSESIGEEGEGSVIDDNTIVNPVSACFKLYSRHYSLGRLFIAGWPVLRYACARAFWYVYHTLKLERIQKRFFVALEKQENILWHLAACTGKARKYFRYRDRLTYFKVHSLEKRKKLLNLQLIFKIIYGKIECSQLLLNNFRVLGANSPI